MKSGQEWIAEYSESHRNPINKLLHWICVPAIMWTVIAFLWIIPVPEALQFSQYANWASLFIIISLFFYFSFDFRIWLGMLLASVLMLIFTEWLALQTSIPMWRIALGVFVIAWIGQFVGHHYEGKKPSFFKDLQFLLVGPAWEMNYLLRKVKIIK